MSAAGAPRWGWHPLTDAWAARIVADAGIRRSDLVLDIGAGQGALTRHLVDAGARVLAIELHPGRADRLRERFAADDVTVVQVDAAELRVPHRPFRVVSNPPYAVTSALLRILLAPGSKLISADLVLQRAAVRRYLDGRPADARRWCRQWTFTAGRILPRTAFRPPPQVDSGVLAIRRVR